MDGPQYHSPRQRTLSKAQKNQSPVLNEELFRDCMQRPDIVAEFFFPLNHASWQDGQFSLNKEEIDEVHSKISGVRLQAADSQDPTLERQCQQDVVKLVESVIRLRETPTLDGIVLSGDGLQSSQPIKGMGTRVKFGLYLDPNGGFRDDTNAARECHRSIVRAVHESGFVVQTPKTFDSKTGMAGLVQWGEALKLRRHRPIWPGLLLLLVLLPCLFWDCRCQINWSGVSIKTQSFIVLVDKSSSMADHFKAVQKEARSVLQRMAGSFFTRYYADVIAYNSAASSALGGLQEVNDQTRQSLLQFLDGLQANAGTNLRLGIDQATKEVAAHKEPTTLLILTDGEDSSIAQMLQDIASVRGQFQGVKIVVNILTPRLFGGKGNPAPIDDTEKQLSELAKALNGRFGPASE